MFRRGSGSSGIVRPVAGLMRRVAGILRPIAGNLRPLSGIMRPLSGYLRPDARQAYEMPIRFHSLNQRIPE